MGKLLVLGLVLAWAAVLAPPLLRRGDERSPSSLDAARTRLASLHHGRRLSVVSRAPIAGSAFATRPAATATSRALQRRRQVAAVLVFSVVVSFLIAVGIRTMSAIAFHLVTDALLVGFVAAMRSVRAGGGRRRVAYSYPTRSVVPDEPQSAVAEVHELRGARRTHPGDQLVDFWAEEFEPRSTDQFKRLRAAN